MAEMKKKKTKKKRVKRFVKKIPGDDAALLCDYVNTQCGLKGTCVSVLVG